MSQKKFKRWDRVILKTTSKYYIYTEFNENIEKLNKIINKVK